MSARRWLLPGLLTLTLILALVSVLVGKITLTWDMWASHDPITRIVFVELRVPRALLAIIIGAALGMSGAAMQSYLRNPLADPGTLGVSAMAALGAVLSIFFGIAGAPSVGAAPVRSRRRNTGDGDTVAARGRDRQRAHARAFGRHPQLRSPSPESRSRCPCRRARGRQARSFAGCSEP